jgi:hypothetical protein
MTAIKVGDRIRDNDPRMGSTRVLKIIAVLPNGVRAEDSMGNVRSYLRKAIHTDGKPRRTGFSLVQPQEASGVDAGAAGASPSDAAK